MTRTAVRAARNIRDAATLDSLGWSLPLSTFRGAKMVGALALVCGCGIVAAIATDALRSAFPPVGVEFAALGAVTVGLYALVAHAVRETLTVRRALLTDHPRADFFRAVGIPRRVVVLTEAAGRLVVMAAVAFGVAAGVFVRASAGQAAGSLLAAVCAMPLAVAAGALAITASVAAWSRRGGRPGPLGAGLCGLAAGGALAVIARGAVDAAAEAQERTGVPLDLWGAAAPVLLLVAVLAAAAASCALRDLGVQDFPIVAITADGPGDGTRRTARHPLPWLRIVLSDLRPPARRAAFSRLVFVSWAVGAAVVGVSLTTRDVFPWAPPTVIVDRLAVAFSFFLGLALAEMLTRWIGPAALSARWRACWEAGGNLTALAATPLAVGVAAMTLVAIPVAAASATLGGDAAVVVAVLWSALAAAWFAAAAVPGEPPGPDGTAGTSLAGAVLCVIVSAALALALLSAATAGLSLLGLVLVVLTLGGALWITRRRILFLPSRSLV